jgi:hypothetical protein
MHAAIIYINHGLTAAAALGEDANAAIAAFGPGRRPHTADSHLVEGSRGIAEEDADQDRGAALYAVVNGIHRQSLDSDAGRILDQDGRGNWISTLQAVGVGLHIGW